MSDPANDAEWRGGSRKAEWSSDGPIDVGSTMRSEDRAWGRKVITTSKITSWDPPFSYGFRSMDKSFPAEFFFQLEPEGEGTLLIAQGNIGFSGMFKVFEWLFGGQIKNQVLNDFITLKNLLEQR